MKNLNKAFNLDFVQFIEVDLVKSQDTTKMEYIFRDIVIRASSIVEYSLTSITAGDIEYEQRQGVVVYKGLVVNHTLEVLDLFLQQGVRRRGVILEFCPKAMVQAVVRTRNTAKTLKRLRQGK